MLCGVQPTTSAIKAIASTSPANDQIVLESKAFGFTGNRTYVTIENGTTSSDFRKFTIERDGVVEVFDDLGTGDLFTVTYTGTEATTMTAEMSDTVKIGSESSSGAFKIKYTKTTLGAGTFIPTEMAFDGTITITPTGAPSSAIQVTVSGTDKSTGAAASETLTFNGSAASQTTTTVFSSVSQIVVNDTSGSGETFTIAGTAIDIATNAYATAQDIVNRINTFSAQKFEATALSPQVSNIQSSDMDLVAAATIKSATVGFTADCSAIVTALAGSTLVTPNFADQYERASFTKPAAGNRQIPDTQAQQPLAGGTVGSATATEWTTALESMQTQDLQTIVPLSNDDAYHKLVRSHCEFMAGKANVPNERKG